MNPAQWAALPIRARAHTLAAAAGVDMVTARRFLSGEPIWRVCVRKRPQKLRDERVDARRAGVLRALEGALERLERPRLVVHVGNGFRDRGPFGCVLELRGGERVPFVFYRLVQQFGPL